LATGPLFLMLVAILKCQTVSCLRIRQILDEILLPWLSPCRLVDLILLATLAGVAEELLFRAFLQSLFTDHVGATAGLVLASLLFGVAHWITPGYAVLASIAGFYLGTVWIMTDGNTLAVIIAHGLYDLVALIVLLHRYRAGPGCVDSDNTITGDVRSTSHLNGR
ncbi:MAG: CPBP family intramembrane glutamic endopeptidase, partial [Planctomycetaceae bacterium]